MKRPELNGGSDVLHDRRSCKRVAAVTRNYLSDDPRQRISYTKKNRKAEPVEARRRRKILGGYVR